MPWPSALRKVAWYSSRVQAGANSTRLWITGPPSPCQACSSRACQMAPALCPTRWTLGACAPWAASQPSRRCSTSMPAAFFWKARSASSFISCQRAKPSGWTRFSIWLSHQELTEPTRSPTKGSLPSRMSPSSASRPVSQMKCSSWTPLSRNAGRHLKVRMAEPLTLFSPPWA
ncbi:hypothetical protein D9M70_522840 [compost metagenome]